MNEHETKNVVDLVKLLSAHPKFGWERAAICAVDCMLQHQEGYLKDTIKAWLRDISDAEKDNGRCSCHRHGAWVPAIPL
jgi:hypothetical protein